MASQNIDPVTHQSSSKPKDNRSNINSDSQSVKKRLQKELMTLMMSPQKGVSAFPDGDDIFTWVGTIDGPDGTAYESLKYRLQMKFPSNYPYEAPNVRFTTACFHPNVDEQGNICLDILKEKWSALYEVRTILLSIQSLLGEPNNESPLNIQAANMWSNQSVYKNHVKTHYSKHNKDAN